MVALTFIGSLVLIKFASICFPVVAFDLIDLGHWTQLNLVKAIKSLLPYWKYLYRRF